MLTFKHKKGLKLDTIIPSYKSITIFVLKLSVNILFCLFQGDIHIAVQANKNTFKVKPV